MVEQICSHHGGQEAERERELESMAVLRVFFSSSFIPSGPPACETVLPTFRAGFSLNLCVTNLLGAS
jgi:hypothetical protein